MTVAQPSRLLHGPYGHGTAPMAVVWPLWLWCGHYGRGAAAMAAMMQVLSFCPGGPNYDLALLPAAATLT
jgi:hypothetical protein